MYSLFPKIELVVIYYYYYKEQQFLYNDVVYYQSQNIISPLPPPKKRTFDIFQFQNNVFLTNCQTPWPYGLQCIFLHYDKMKIFFTAFLEAIQQSHYVHISAFKT